MKLKLTFALAIALLLVSFPLSAQTKVQYFSTFAKNGVVPDDCVQAKSVIVPYIVAYHAPQGWTWIIACDEHAWHQVEVHLGAEGIQGQMLAASDLTAHVTYIRGYAVLHPFTDAAIAQPEHTIAHELSHVLLNSRDEVRVERQAQVWLKDHLSIAVASLKE